MPTNPRCSAAFAATLPFHPVAHREPGARYVALVWLSEGPTRPLETLGAFAVIGRSSSSELQVLDASVSRRHAAVGVEDGEAWLEDLGSQNGTFVNGVRVTGRVALYHRDRISIGESSHLVVIESTVPVSGWQPEPAETELDATFADLPTHRSGRVLRLTGEAAGR
jgi:hypothetical protein